MWFQDWRNSWLTSYSCSKKEKKESYPVLVNSSWNNPIVLFTKEILTKCFIMVLFLPNFASWKMTHPRLSVIYLCARVRITKKWIIYRKMGRNLEFLLLFICQQRWKHVWCEETNCGTAPSTIVHFPLSPSPWRKHQSRRECSWLLFVPYNTPTRLFLPQMDAFTKVPSIVMTYPRCKRRTSVRSLEFFHGSGFLWLPVKRRTRASSGPFSLLFNDPWNVPD